MDVPTPPAIVFEHRAPCSDAAKAEDLLKRTLAPAVAPRPAWTVSARFSRKGGSLVAEGEIRDEFDAPVAHRVLTERSQECSPLSRAVGVWASLVLDSEVERASRIEPPVSVNPPAAEASSPAAPKPSEAPASSLVEPTSASLELGVTMSLMGGLGSGVVAGPTLYAGVETGKGWFFRPALFVERTLEEVAPTSDVYGTLVATRFDFCGRTSGFHIRRLQFDWCGGAEIGFMHFDEPSVQEGGTAPNPTLPFLALGPSASLRGEIGEGIALILRGVVDLNVVRDGDGSLNVDPSLFLGRAELGLSWQP